MSNKTIDCSGLSCPEPVLRVRRALQEDPSLRQVEVKVSAAAARDNVSRAARGMGWQVAMQAEEGGFSLKLSRKGRRE
jgi:TusA-related sulfurtransferase